MKHSQYVTVSHSLGYRGWSVALDAGIMVSIADGLDKQDGMYLADQLTKAIRTIEKAAYLRGKKSGVTLRGRSLVRDGKIVRLPVKHPMRPVLPNAGNQGQLPRKGTK